jgi:hypothetical protein
VISLEIVSVLWHLSGLLPFVNEESRHSHIDQAVIGFLSKENSSSERQSEDQKLVRGIFVKGRICKGHSNQKQNQKKYTICTERPSGYRWVNPILQKGQEHYEKTSVRWFDRADV